MSAIWNVAMAKKYRCGEDKKSMQSREENAKRTGT